MRMRIVASSISPSSSSKLFRAFASPLAHGVATSAKPHRIRVSAKSRPTLVKEKRRTRSDREFELDEARRFGGAASHVPVMLGEVSDVFASSESRSLRSFVDCTVGAAGHSSAVSTLISHFHLLTIFTCLYIQLCIFVYIDFIMHESYD